jgi:hypothetical protein
MKNGDQKRHVPEMFDEYDFSKGVQGKYVERLTQKVKFHVKPQRYFRKLMPAKNFYHDAVVNALIADGWTITDDPLPLSYGGRDLYVDFGAERGTIAAEKNGEKIAVEIKSFLGRSIMHDIEKAVGQYQIYLSILANTEPDRLIYLAVPQRVDDEFFTEKIGQLILNSMHIRLIVFDDQKERIVKWIN